MPCASSHFSFDAARTKPSKLPRGCSPCPPQLRGGQERHGDLLPDGRARPVVLVVQRVREDLVAEVAAVLLQLAVGERLVAADQLAGDAAPRAALAEAVLHRLHLHVVPVRPEGGEDAAVVGHVAVPVGRAFPDAHRREVRRLQRGDVPLVDAVVGDAVQARPCRSTRAARPPIRCSRRSPASRAARNDRCNPGERPAPRESTRTQA